MKVVLIAAQSLDGFITFHDEPGSAFTSPEDKLYFRDALREFPLRIMGSGTYRATRDFVRKMAKPAYRTVVLTRQPAAFAADAIEDQLEFRAESPADLVAAYENRYERCALIGGSELHASFLEADLIDELWLTVEPRLFGAGKKLFAHPTNAHPELVNMTLLNASTLLLKYRL